MHNTLLILLLSADVLRQSPGPAGGRGSVRPAGLPPRSLSVGAALPALSPPAGLPAVQQPARSAPQVSLQGGVQVCAQHLRNLEIINPYDFSNLCTVTNSSEVCQHCTRCIRLK